jgi:GntR family transcriptional regulator, transcriptional repressor for pyruvate dehydrogenase complex
LSALANPMTNTLHSPSVADTIAAHLERLILEGALRPGEKLAAERELAKRFGVSRPSLREALDKLARRGLLVTGRSGTRVADFLRPFADPLATLFRDNNQNSRLTLEYYEFRQAIEVRASGLAAFRATEIDRDAIRDCIGKMNAAHRLEDPTQEADADADLHMLIYEAAHNVVLLHVMRAFSSMHRQGVFFVREQLYGRPGVREALLAQHIAIGDAVLAGDAEMAEQAAFDHLQFSIEAFKQIRSEQMRLEAALLRMGRSALLSN